MAEPAEVVVDSVAFRAATPRRRVRFLVFATYVAVLAVWSVAVAIYAHPVLGALAAAFFVELGVAIVRVAGSSGDAVIDPVIDPVAATRIAEPLKELCAKAGCILPLVLIRNDQMRAAAVVERGSRPLLILSAPFVESVNHRQLRALLAHEVVHLAHSDTGRLRRRGRILMLTSVLAGGVTAAALQAGSALPIVIAGMVLGARLVSIPLALAQRRLERRADREGAGLCEDPRALAEALAAAADMSQQTRARLFGPPIVRSLLWPVVGRLPTHPPMAERTRALLAMSGEHLSTQLPSAR